MSDEIAHLPVWVRRQDGSQVPFEADRICQSLYAAAASLGAASAFVIRELTDGVLYFLARHDFDAIPTTAQIAEQVSQVLRRNEEARIYHWFAETGTFPPPRTRPDG